MSTLALQDVTTGNYRAVIPITAGTPIASPKRDVTNGVVTALLELINLVDQSGNAIGVSGNPLVVSSTASSGNSGTATVTTVAANAASTSLHAANTSRLGIVVTNPGTIGTIFVLYGSGTASATNYTYAVAPQSSWAMPTPIYTGALQGIWSTAASGAQSAVVTELTA